ncbi:MAG: hypothetical protein A2381_02845 [Bdellovibrionales bacterium RIFOXYB1_FULL_37_110]|nr:MAG: hypothetical protein A2181_03225 [Bdellovibrionales bacterium RIFOXYA1_FULL_38_20]OFZ51443.1 MAG: hypothetical protein A2417_09300 [Bdellovibrionales bacterium RIFOXYC1_FULL_37_79]OFZ57871.1 MAG: hypothetical protein A2381_02845 [Bdellovibrionales bacterium RIFOXYB1_FULL_37_110]OFZ63597.1 MAG: hypothetical protein A2577_05145 [Bdellovibrionales bacterium RIFOXYD1_FULL_36_51]
MTKLFNFNTLNIDLNKETKSLTVTLNRKESWNAINFEMIFELEQIFSWACERIEINSILLTSDLDIFSSGFEYKEFLNTPEHKIQKYLQKFQKIIYSMFMLPQTIIIDLKKGASGAACELAIGADIRFAHQQSTIHFNHLEMGLIPSCGGIGFLSSIIPKSTAKNWILSGSSISMHELLQSGFIFKSYSDDEKLIAAQLNHICQQSQVARMQAKRSMLEPVLSELNHTLEFEKNFAFGTMYAPDWKKSLEAKINGDKPDFISARDFKEVLKFHSKLNLKEA